MAPPPVKKAKAGAKKAGGMLTRKAGPLPVWAWGAIGLAAVLLVYYVRRNRSGAGYGYEVNALPRVPDGAFAGSPSTATPPAASLDPAILDQLERIIQENNGYGQHAVAVAQDARGVVDDYIAANDGRWGSLEGSFFTVSEQLAAIPDATAQAVAAATAGRPAPAPAGPAGGAKKPAPAKPAAPVRYYTYKPGKAPAGRKKDAAPAKAPPGKKLKFAAGRGYYYG